MALEIKVTLRVYSEKLTLKYLKEYLGEPSRGFSVGDSYSKGEKTRKHTFWCLHSTISRKGSLDEHVANILDFIETKENELLKLKQEGCDIDLSCFLDSDNGQGGTTLSSVTMGRLSAFELGLSFDIYADVE